MLKEAEATKFFLGNAYNAISEVGIRSPLRGRRAGREVKDKSRPKVAGEQIAYHFRSLGHEEAFSHAVLLLFERAYQLELTLRNHQKV